MLLALLTVTGTSADDQAHPTDPTLRIVPAASVRSEGGRLVVEGLTLCDGTPAGEYMLVVNDLTPPDGPFGALPPAYIPMVVEQHVDHAAAVAAAAAAAEAAAAALAAGTPGADGVKKKWR